MRKNSEFNKKPLATILLFTLLMLLLVGCGGGDGDRQVDSTAQPRVISIEEFYTSTPEAIGPDLQATRAAVRATEIDQALRSIEAKLTPAP